MKKIICSLMISMVFCLNISANDLKTQKIPIYLDVFESKKNENMRLVFTCELEIKASKKSPIKYSSTEYVNIRFYQGLEVIEEEEVKNKTCAEAIEIAFEFAKENNLGFKDRIYPPYLLEALYARAKKK